MAKKHFEKSEMDELMATKKGKQYEILYNLKQPNRDAMLFMKGQGKPFKKKYHDLWGTSYWAIGKALLKEYFTIEGNGVLKCKTCGKSIDNSFTLHHEVYNIHELFNPLFVSIVHSNSGCHPKTIKKTHKKTSRKKRVK